MALHPSAKPRILAFVLAGGEGSRLRPLTRDVAKPAVPFAGGYRIVDFVLSNLVNSGISDIHLLAQYQPRSLIEHVRKAWAHRGVSVVQPMANGASTEPAARFAGTADAVAQNRRLVERAKPDLVAVFGSDHIYRMDFAQMVEAHRQRQADVTVATLAVPRSQARAFGVVDVDPSYRITRFREKPPVVPHGLAGRPDHVLASMGNYLFDATVLMDVVGSGRRGAHDFGGDLLPELVQTHRLLAYDFESNEVPGLHPFEEPAYWRDVGTVDAYFAAHVDALGPLPRFRIDNPSWPIHGAPHGGRRPRFAGAVPRCSVCAPNVVVGDARLDHVCLQDGVRVHDHAVVERSIVMERAVIGRGARVRHAILEAGCVVAPGDSIGHDLDRDRRRFMVTDGGVVVVTRERLADPAFQKQPQVPALA